MATRTIRSVVPKSYDGAALLDYLAERFTYKSREEWEKEIADGKFVVNDLEGRAETILKHSDAVSYTSDDYKEPPVDKAIEILHADASLLVVAKPGNLPVHASGAYLFNTLMQALLESGYGELGEDSTLHAAHRLDRETSGVILIARTKEAKAHLARQFDEGSASKIYQAVVYGDIEESEFVVEKSIVKDSSSPFRSFYTTAEEGPRAATKFRTLIRYGGYTLIEAEPQTGRPHQIRVHLASLGHPVVGDKKYLLGPEGFDDFVNGRRLEELEQVWVTPRHMLHALSLDFLHPATNEPWHAEAPLPEDMKRFLQKLQLAASSES